MCVTKVLTLGRDICMVLWSPYKLQIDVVKEIFLTHLRETLRTVKENENVTNIFCVFLRIDIPKASPAALSALFPGFLSWERGYSFIYGFCSCMLYTETEFWT